MSDKRVKITKLPPVEQDVFFQEQQFDEELGGTDPKQYLNGGTVSRKQPTADGEAAFAGKRNLNKIYEKALEGHENKEEILKVTRGQ
jgi:hypothetical protein